MVVKGDIAPGGKHCREESEIESDERVDVMRETGGVAVQGGGDRR